VFPPRPLFKISNRQRRQKGRFNPFRQKDTPKKEFHQKYERRNRMPRTMGYQRRMQKHVQLETGYSPDKKEISHIKG
jgi:hypothetical protein